MRKISQYIVYWQILKTQHLANSLDLYLKKEGKPIILVAC